MTPIEAFDDLVAGLAEHAAPDALDYADSTQAARYVVIDGERLRERDIRQDGFPRSGARPEHPGVILAFDSKHGPLKYPCDTYTDWQDNLRGVVLAMDALRRVDRYGVTKRGEQYTGWKALPPGSGAVASGMTVTDARDVVIRLAGVLGGGHVERPAPDVLAGLARTAKANVHPDRNGGDRAQWNLLENATTALRQAGWMR